MKQVVRALHAIDYIKGSEYLREGSNRYTKVELKMSTSYRIMPVKTFFACPILAANFRELSGSSAFYGILLCW